MVTTCQHDLPHGISLHCRVSGQPGQPLLLMLHGFPEGAFIWDQLLEEFGTQYRCVAPDLRGYGHSSQPEGVAQYKAKLLIQDLSALIALEGQGQPAACVLAHDWGGALAWGLANQHPQQLRRLMILNAPHPGAFLRELQHNPLQQAASQYMHFLRRSDAPALLAANNWQRMLGFFQTRDGTLPAWLTPLVQQQYREHWGLGVAGACHYYSASPLVPVPDARCQAQGDAPVSPHGDIHSLVLPASMLAIDVPTKVLWGDADPALHPALLDGLGEWVAQLQVQHLPGTSHWVLHEQPEAVLEALKQWLAQD